MHGVCWAAIQIQRTIQAALEEKLAIENYLPLAVPTNAAENRISPIALATNCSHSWKANFVTGSQADLRTSPVKHYIVQQTPSENGCIDVTPE